ncbi:MAG: hypothetical protein U1E45_12955 [Geminicoccaceae bacterium]
MAMRRMAVGQQAEAVARAVGVPEAEIRAMLADSGMLEVLATYRDLLVLPEALKLHMLRVVSVQVVLEAVEEREPRVCAWFFHETQRDRDPFDEVAKATHRMLERTPPPEPPRRPPSAPPDPLACDPMSDAYARRARRRVLAMLRLRLIEELAFRRSMLLDELGHDPLQPAPASLDWRAGLSMPPLRDRAAATRVPEPRAGP